MNKKKIKDELHKMLDKPFKEFMAAAKRWHDQPNIQNGARKQEARDMLDDALRAAAEHALENWHLTPEDFNAIVDEVSVSDFTSSYN